MMEILKKLLKFAAYIFVILFILGLVIGGVIYLTSPPSYAGFNDNVILDIGQDGYMIATIEDALEYKNEKIPDGEVKISSDTVLKWKDARNVSFVDTVGKNEIAIKKYIDGQLKEDMMSEQLTLDKINPFTGSKK